MNRDELSWQFPLLTERFVSVSETVIEKRSFTQTALNRASIRLLNWNIAKQNNSRQWFVDFTDLLERYQPDLVCLQEVSLNLQAQEILALEAMGWSFAPNFIDASQDCYCGILTAAHAQPLSSRALITQSSEPFTNTPKVSLITEYALRGSQHTVLVINAHAINFVSLQKFEAQLQQIQVYLSQYPNPLILVGDFNTWSQNRLEIFHQMVTQLSLQKVEFSSLDQKQIKRFLLSPPLDHICYRGMAVKPRSAMVLGNITSSDHKPMLTQFSISIET